MTQNRYSGKNTPWQQTFSGKEIIFQEILEGNMHDQINIEDIANALSYQCRYAGHVSFHYSVLHHSLLASYVMELYEGDPLEGLCHDLHEAYITDLPTPIKRVLGPSWYQFEDAFQAQIYKALGLNLDVPMSTVCKMVDYAMLAWESGGFAIDRINSWGIPSNILDMSTKIQKVAEEQDLARPMEPEELRKRFLIRYHELTK